MVLRNWGVIGLALKVLGIGGNGIGLTQSTVGEFERILEPEPKTCVEQVGRNDIDRRRGFDCHRSDR